MNLLDKILRVFGTNRVRLGWRWRNFKEGFGKGGDGAGPRRARGSLIPDDFPVVTVALLGVIGVFYVLTVKLTSDMTAESTTQPSPFALFRYGSTFTPAVMLGEWWRTITSVFLHAGLLHILMNSLALWTLGTLAEDRFGRARMLVVFVVTGAVGMLTSVWWRDITNVVGASGAIFGLMGCILASSFRHGGREAAARELRARLVPWLLYALVIGFAIPGIDNAAHLGGLVSGAVFGFFLGDRAVARRVRYVWEILAFVVLVAVVLSFIAAAQSPLPDMMS